MLIQLILTFGILVTTLQTVIELNERKKVKTFNEFNVNPDDITTNQCTIHNSLNRATHLLFNTCPTSYDPICDDPMFNKYNEFEFRCRFPMRTNSPLLMNSTSFMELMRMRDPYARDWCMVVLFHSPSCPFSARLAPHFNKVAGVFENILPIAVDASDFTNESVLTPVSSRTHRLNFRYGVSGTPTVLLWVSGIGVARMGNKDLDLESIKELITTHTDLVERKETQTTRENIIPDKFFELGAELKELVIETDDFQLMNTLYTLACFLVCMTTFIYHCRERILLSAPVLQWFQSKCGIPLCEDIYFLFYVAAPRNRGPPPPPPPVPEPAPAEEAPAAEAAELNDDDLPPLIINDE